MTMPGVRRWFSIWNRGDFAGAVEDAGMSARSKVDHGGRSESLRTSLAKRNLRAMQTWARPQL